MLKVVMVLRPGMSVLNKRGAKKLWGGPRQELLAGDNKGEWRADV